MKFNRATPHYAVICGECRWKVEPIRSYRSAQHWKRYHQDGGGSPIQYLPAPRPNHRVEIQRIALLAQADR